MSEIVSINELGKNHSEAIRQKLTLLNELTGGEELITADSEGFEEPYSYLTLIKQMDLLFFGRLEINDLKVEQMIYSEDINSIQAKIYFQSNNQSHLIEVKRSESYLAVFSYINRLISDQLNGEWKFHFVEPFGIENADQNFFLLFAGSDCYGELTKYGFTHSSANSKIKDAGSNFKSDLEEFLRSHAHALDFIDRASLSSASKEMRGLFLIDEEVSFIKRIESKIINGDILTKVQVVTEELYNTRIEIIDKRDADKLELFYTVTYMEACERIKEYCVG